MPTMMPMPTETIPEDLRRLQCVHEPTAIQLSIGGEPFRLLSCSRCEWREWVADDVVRELSEVLARIAADR